MTDPSYIEEFDKAFSSQPITDAQFVTALAHFMASIQNYESPYDQWMKGDSTSLDKKSVTD